MGIKTFGRELVGKKTEGELIARKVSNKQFLLQVGIYAGLVVGYFFLVVSLLHDRIKNLFDQQKAVYAVVAWTLIAGQGVVLEVIAVAIHRFVRKKIG
jgi:hypothetical protein